MVPEIRQCCLLAAGSRLLDYETDPFAPEVKSQKPEARSQKPKNYQRYDIRNHSVCPVYGR